MKTSLSTLNTKKIHLIIENNKFLTYTYISTFIHFFIIMSDNVTVKHIIIIDYNSNKNVFGCRIFLFSREYLIF